LTRETREFEQPLLASHRCEQESRDTQVNVEPRPVKTSASGAHGNACALFDWCVRQLGNRGGREAEQESAREFDQDPLRAPIVVRADRAATALTATEVLTRLTPT
jgi:hypothetical protein